jgi:hypothetical protein
MPSTTRGAGPARAVRTGPRPRVDYLMPAAAQASAKSAVQTALTV